MDGLSKERHCNADIFTPCVISDFRREVCEKCALLGHYAASTLPARFSFVAPECLITTAAILRQYQLITQKPRAFYNVEFGTQFRGPSIGENGKQRGTGPSPELQILDDSRLTRTD